MQPNDPNAFSQILDILPRRNHDKSLGLAIRTFANRIIRKGGKCPCCGRHGKVDVRSLTGNPTRALLWLVSVSGPQRRWVNVPEEAPKAVLRTKKLSQLKHWRLIEQKIQPNGHTKKSGVWRPTQKGLAFAADQILIPHRVFVFNDRKLGHSDKMIGIKAALGKQYNYQQEIARTWLGERTRP